MKGLSRHRLTWLAAIVALLGCRGGERSSIESSVLPQVAGESGQFRNLFVELGGHTQAEVDAKIEEMKQRFFFGDNDQRLYYESSDGGAYIFAVDSNDVRTEGMSYGMMIAVQLGMKTEFDKLWNWAKTHMQHSSGDMKGYFAWQCDPAGNQLDETSAPDGEEYFAMALFFAWKRWGDAYYKQEADAILDAMLHQGERAAPGSGVTSVFLEAEGKKMVTFVPYQEGAAFTDPSYHLPAFYELWARWADKDNEDWARIAKDSRAFLTTTIYSPTGLGPDYANYDGTPNDGNTWRGESGHSDFRYDAWRTAMNIAIDQYWWGVNTDWAVNHADTLQAFFEGKGLSSYGSLWTLDGNTELSAAHLPGLVAMNAVASLTASDTARAKRFLEELWNLPIPSGGGRYYHGCLYVLAMLHLSGNFQIYGERYALDVSATGMGSGTVASNPAGITCGNDCSEVYLDGTEVVLTAAPSAGSVFVGWTGACSGMGTCKVKMGGPTSVTAKFKPDPGPLVVTPVIAQNQPYFTEEQVRFDNTAPLTALSIAIVVQKTTGLSFSNQWDNVGDQIRLSHTTSANTIVYTFELVSGRTVPPGNVRTFSAQMNGIGLVHPTAGDTYWITYTMDGQTYKQAGHF